MEKQTLGWIFFGLGVVFTLFIAPLAVIFYIVAIVFFAKSRKETGGLVGLILSIISLLGALVLSLFFILYIVLAGSLFATNMAFDSGNMDIDLPSIEPYQSTAANAAYWIVEADVGVDSDFSVSGTHELVLRNNQDSTIKITDVELLTDSQSTGTLLLEDRSLGIGQEVTLTEGLASIDNLNICSNVGDEYSVNVIITYEKVVGGSSSSIEFNPTQTLDGTCAN